MVKKCEVLLWGIPSPNHFDTVKVSFCRNRTFYHIGTLGPLGYAYVLKCFSDIPFRLLVGGGGG